MDDSTLISRLMAALPESLWAEVTRRLRACPELWLAAHEPETLDAFLELDADLDQWRPGPLGLAYVSARVPEAEGDAEGWLIRSREATQRLDAVIASLRDGDTDLDLADATIAAVALRSRRFADGAWGGVVRDAVRGGRRWRLPLMCLYGLIDDPGGLLGALFTDGGEEGARLVANVLWLNCAADELAAEIRGIAPTLRRHHLLAFAGAVRELGDDRLAARVVETTLSPSTGPLTPPAGDTLSVGDSPALARYVATEVEHALLAGAAGHPAAAQTILTAASHSLYQLSAILATANGTAALEAGDYVSALAAFQYALAGSAADPSRRDIHELLAQSLIALGRPADALAELAQLPDPPPLAMARAHHALGLADDALKWARSALAQDLCHASRVTHRATSDLTSLIPLFLNLGDSPSALAAQTQLVACRPTDGAEHAHLAEMLWNAGRAGEARETASLALALGPADARFSARKIVAASLASSGQHEAAVEHWKAALAAAPGDADLALGLARSAHAAGQLQLAAEAAEVAIAGGREAAEQHRIIAEASAAQGNEARAVDHYERAVALEPNALAPWLFLADHRRRNGDLAGAAAAFEAANRAAPESPEIAADLARLYEELDRPSAAIAAWRRACDLAPDEPRYHRALGLLLYDSHDCRGAMDSLRRATQLVSDDGLALHRLGLALAQAGERHEALGVLEKCVALAPRSAEPYLDFGRLALQFERFDSALPALRQAIAVRPDDSDTHVLIGAACEATADMFGALEAYRQAMSLAPTRTDLNLRIGMCCVATGQVEAAIAALTDAAEIDPESVVTFRELGRVYAASDLWPEAAMAFERAAALAADTSDPDVSTLHRLHGGAALAVALTPGADAEHWNTRAVAALSQAVRVNPLDAAALSELGGALAALGRVAEAREAYEAALVLVPDSAPVHLVAGEAMISFGDHERACQLLDRAVQLDPSSIEIARTAAAANLKAGRLDAAHLAFVRAADLVATTSGPERAAYLRQAGECLWSLGRHGMAVELWRSALAADTNDRVARARLGSALLRQSQYTEALAELERVAHDRPDDPAVALDAARAAMGAEDFVKAAMHFERAIGLTPGDAETHYLYGQALVALHRPQRALAAFRQASRLNSREGLYLAALASVLAEQGEVAEAVVAAESALDLGGGQADVLSAAGEIFLLSKDFVRSVESLRRAADARPSDGFAWLALARALTQLVEAEDRRAEAGLPHDPRQATTETRQLLENSLRQSALLGVDPLILREWMGRERAVIGDPKEAIVILEATTASVGASASPEVYHALGHAYRRDGALERARTALEAATARDSLNAPALIELGQVALALDDKSGALAAFRRAAALAPRDPAAFNFLAEALLALGDRKEAASALSRAIALEPHVAAWHYRLAGIHDARREHGQSLAGYQRAVELEPESAEYVLGLARALAREGDLADAAGHYERATKLKPGSAMAWCERGELALQLADWESAAQCFAKAIALAPANAAALMGGARAALALGRVLEAQTKTNAALRLRPEDPAALACLADVCAARGDTAGALEANSKAMSHTPDGEDTTALYLSRAQILRAAGQLDEAISTLQRLVKLQPSSDEAYGLLGDALIVTRRFDEAIEAYRQAISIAPGSAAHLLRLGRACFESGQLDQALSYLLQAREARPDDPEIYREIGKTYEARRQIDRALEAYEEAIRLDPRQAENYYRAAMAHKLLKQYGEAHRLLQRVSELDPTHVEAHRHLVQVAALDLLHSRAARDETPSG
ncbi:MAG: tetratricopeptide repeat protein [Chloroflexi bacterium]|nr:tetratricopeptide repeat protein [Chloroflexota bacterium]